MTDYEALAVVIAIVAAVCYGPRLLGRLHIWRRCACGARYCTTCGRRGE